MGVVTKTSLLFQAVQIVLPVYIPPKPTSALNAILLKTSPCLFLRTEVLKWHDDFSRSGCLLKRFVSYFHSRLKGRQCLTPPDAAWCQNKLEKVSVPCYFEFLSLPVAMIYMMCCNWFYISQLSWTAMRLNGTFKENLNSP